MAEMADTADSGPRPSPQRISYPRQRAIRACQLCRARRIKCDNAKPACSSCEKAGAECVTVEGTSVLDAGSLQILQRLDDLELLVKSLQPAKDAAATVGTTKQVRQLRVSTEELLSWTVFQGHYDSRRDLKALLRRGSSAASTTSPVSINASLLADDLDSYPHGRLLASFFQSVHVKNPMLDEGKIKQIVHHMSLEGPSWNAESCLALVVCALGAIASSFDTDVNSTESQVTAAAEAYYNAAQRRLGIIIGSGGVLEAQCFFYCGVYLMCKLQPLSAWRLFCQALTCCQEFACADPSYQQALIRVPSCRNRLPAEECVYWSCWKSELELRSFLDLPDFAFNDLCYPLLFPTPPDSIQEPHATAWYFYLSEISLRRLEYRVREEIDNALKAKETFCPNEFCRTTRAMEVLADEWTRTLPAAMNLQTPQAEDDVLKFVLRGHLLNLWEIIYWPWLEVFINQRLYTAEVETYLAKGFQIAIDRIRINKPGFRHRHHGTWFMLQSCVRSVLGLLAAAYIPESARLLPHEWREAVVQVTDLLRFWQYDAGDAADRLHILEELMAGIS